MRKNVALFLWRHISVLWNLALAEYGGHGLCSIANNSSINISREICPFNWNCKKNELWSANNFNGSELAFRRHHITMVLLICIWVKVRGFGNILSCLNLRTKQNKKQNKSKLKLKQFCHDLNEWVLFGFLCGLAFCYQLTVSWKGFYIWGFSYNSVYPTTGHGITLLTTLHFISLAYGCLSRFWYHHLCIL